MYKLISLFSFLIFILLIAGCKENGTLQTEENNISYNYLVTGPTDECQNEYVIINFNNKVIYTEIKNYITPDGDCLAKRILECLRTSKNHGQFVSCMAHLTNSWKKAGIITNTEKGEIMVWAAQADIP